MLRYLRIRNFAIIDELELEFGPGFNVITGETGAGKSILLEALGLVLGNRASADVVRHGVEEASVEALFDVARNDAVLTKLVKQGLKPGESELLVRRIVNRNGKNKIFLNGELVTLAQLAEICESLVDLCSQHEHQSLVKPEYQIEILDRYGGLMQKRRETSEIFTSFRSHEAQIAALQSSEGTERVDYLKFQLSEIEELGFRAGEEDELLSERKKLQSASQLIEAADVSREGAENILTILSKAAQKVNKACELDSGLTAAKEHFDRARVEIEEASYFLNSYASGLEIDPEKLTAIEDRLAKWASLRRKYGPSFEEVESKRGSLASELDELTHRQERIEHLQAILKDIRDAYQKTAAELSKKRQNMAKTLSVSIQKEISELAMGSAKFSVEVQPSDTWSATGLDSVQFLFSANAGESLKTLGKVASGGELSRVLLAIRRTISQHGGVGVYVFDEIDSGIGGQTASVVGKKLQSLASHNQILCITHLPQVAACANQHYLVSKKETKGRTISTIEPLNKEKRVLEVARMLGGLNITDKSRAHAKELLRLAE